MDMHNTSALVVEGGAMRGIFAAGVLDAFMAAAYCPFAYAFGVSAGSTNLMGYLCNEHGRSRKIIMEHACAPEFINWRRFIKGGHLCDVHWLWHQSYEDVPLNLEHYLNGNTPLWVGVTAVRSGEPRYIRIDRDNMHSVLTASCSIPVAYRDYPLVNGEPMSDGGLIDSIPVERAYEEGARDITVILSRPLGYRKKPSRLPAVTRSVFREYPALAEALLQRHERYNASLAFITEPPADCRVRIIAPPARFPVGRLTRQPERLAEGYREGLEAARDYLENVGALEALLTSA
ncbi:MAG: patatin family protein [unclassified Hahellaceae]|nr:patatin family protein [Hahellaceae bacterium]|tara:strand:+ start:87941 stop:88810 length:870 start_codon:yes stop_codon:yes gene_type:complete